MERNRPSLNQDAQTVGIPRRMIAACYRRGVRTLANSAREPASGWKPCRIRPHDSMWNGQ